MPLPLAGETAKQCDARVEAAVEGEQPVTLLWDGTRLLRAGYEFTRQQGAEVGSQRVTWSERVQVVRSLALAQREAQRLERRLSRAEAALWKLTPPPGWGNRQYRDEAALEQAVTQVLEKHGVAGLLQVRWQREEELITRYAGPGRPGPNRPTRLERRVRYVITEVQRDTEAIARHKARPPARPEAGPAGWAGGYKPPLRRPSRWSWPGVWSTTGAAGVWSGISIW